MLHLDDASMDLGDECVDAADGEKRKQRELPGKLQKHRRHHRRCVHHANATETGAIAANAHNRGTRSTAMAKKVSAATAVCQGMRRIERAILHPIAVISRVRAAE